jgi:hypothetical protein
VDDLERRLRDLRHQLPDPPEESRRRVERAVLEALRARQRPARPRWVVVAASLAIGACAAGAALAATDNLDVRIGPPKEPAAAPAPGPVRVPAGLDGVALVAGDRLWLGTRSGLGVQGLAVSAAELSPSALYAAVGIGGSLVAMAPDGREAWSHPTGGRVVAAAWAPNPIVVAYVVRRGERNELRVIEGNGRNDQLVDADVGRARPSWRADTHAIAYVGADGRPRVADYPGLASREVDAPPGRVSAVAFAPDGERLALARAEGGLAVSVRGDEASGGWVPLGGRRTALAALAWGTSQELLVGGADPSDPSGARLWRVFAGAMGVGKPSAQAPAAGLAALAPLGDDRVVAAVRTGRGVQVWEADLPSGEAALAPTRVLLRVPAPTGAPVALSTR